MKKPKDKHTTAVGGFIKGLYEECGASVEIIGSSRIIIENVKSILEYEPDCVRVITNEKNVAVCGAELMLKSYSGETVIVSGNITGVNLEG